VSEGEVPSFKLCDGGGLNSTQLGVSEFGTTSQTQPRNRWPMGAREETRQKDWLNRISGRVKYWT